MVNEGKGLIVTKPKERSIIIEIRHLEPQCYEVLMKRLRRRSLFFFPSLFRLLAGIPCTFDVFNEKGESLRLNWIERMEVKKKMSKIVRDIVQFFKTRKISAAVSPTIKVSYEHWTSFNETPDVEEALKKAWEGLRSQLEASQIKKQEWNTYREGYKQEELLVDIEGVLMELEGPYYPDPEYKPRSPEPLKTTEQSANETLDTLLQRTDVLWAITHCSNEKFYAFINFLKATKEVKQ
jgi:hypothetical protein